LKGMRVKEESGGKKSIYSFFPEFFGSFGGVDFLDDGVDSGPDDRPIGLRLADVYAEVASRTYVVGDVGGANEGFTGYAARPGAVAALQVGLDDSDALAKPSGKSGRSQAS